jgi:hypothetical protein
MDKLIQNFSIKSLSDFFKNNANLKPQHEDLAYIIEDKDFPDFSELTRIGNVEFKNSDEDFGPVPFFKESIISSTDKRFLLFVLIIRLEDIKSLIETISSGFEFGLRFTPLNAIKKESFKIVVLGLVSSVKSASIATESIPLLFLIQSLAI